VGRNPLGLLVMVIIYYLGYSEYIQGQEVSIQEGTLKEEKWRSEGFVVGCAPLLRLLAFLFLEDLSGDELLFNAHAPFYHVLEF